VSANAEKAALFCPLFSVVFHSMSKGHVKKTRLLRTLEMVSQGFALATRNQFSWKIMKAAIHSSVKDHALLAKKSN